MWLVRSAFRPYVHAPSEVEALLRREGLTRVHQDRTATWLTEVWIRSADPGAASPPHG